MEIIDERSRQILELRYTLEKSNMEIANESGIQPDSVGMVLR